MKFRNLALAATALLLPFAAVSCGDDSTGDLDKGDIVDELKKADIPEDQANCMADALIKADLTKDELDKLNSGEDIDADKQSAFTAALTDCITG